MVSILTEAPLSALYIHIFLIFHLLLSLSLHCTAQDTLKYDTFSSALERDPGVTEKVGKAGYVFVAGSSLGIGLSSRKGPQSDDGEDVSGNGNELGACDTVYGTSAGGSTALVPLLERCSMDNKAVFLSLVGTQPLLQSCHHHYLTVLTPPPYAFL